MNIGIFERRLTTAQRNYLKYVSKNESHINLLGFVSAGHLSKQAGNRLKTMKNVRHDKSIKISYLEIMLKIAKLELVTGQYPYNKINWEGISSILSDCDKSKYFNDETDYYWLSHCPTSGLGDKLNAIKYFINRYGDATDKKLLIPKLTPKDLY